MNKEQIKLCKELVFLNYQIKIYNDELNELKNKVIFMFKKLKIENVNISISGGNEQEIKEHFYNVKLITRNNVNFDIEKLKSKINKKQKSKILERKVTISDFSGFSKFMKENGISFSQVKCFLDIDEKVNIKKLDDLFKRDEIDLEKINDCYKIVKSNYLKISEYKDE